MLKLSGIKKDYKVADGYVHALKGIDLVFRKNEFVYILGQSGCGKTTLLNVIGGLDHYTEGDLIIQGKSTKDFKDRDWDVYRNHRIGFIFQTYNLIPHQTVLGNVELALTIAGIPRDERRERARQALERVGLGEELNKRPNQLSGGQMQRVAIARALVNNPDILLADEPTGALDSKTSVEVMDLIKEIAGERLVIMVTHNPELAEKYATRIVRLKDGLVESDSDPYTDELEEERWDVDREAESVKSKKKEGQKARAKMSFLTSLSLSARNLLTKKGRTILTSVAGSIGIISVCLVLALSSGFNNYIKKTEEDMLSYYPVQVTENTFDMTAVMGAMQSYQPDIDLEKIDDKAYVNSFLTGLAHNMAVQNDISEKYLNFIRDMDPALVNAISYGYGTTLLDNIYTNVTTGGVFHDGVRTERVEQNLSLTQLKSFYIKELRTYAPTYNSLLSMADLFGNIVHKMPNTAKAGEEGFSDFVLSQYDLLGGKKAHFPQNENEAVLVVGENSMITDMTVAQLGMLDEEKFISPFLKEQGTDQTNWDHSIDFSEIIGKKYVLAFNDAVYSAKGGNPLMGSYPFEYNGDWNNKGDWAEYHVPEDEGIEVTVTAVLRLKSNYTYGCLTEGLNLTEETFMSYLTHNLDSEIVQWMKSPSAKVPQFVIDELVKVNPQLSAGTELYYAPASNLSGKNGFVPAGNFAVAYDLDSAIRLLGGNDAPNSVSIYPKDFDSKEEVINYLDSWNELPTTTEEEKITYTDTVGLLMKMVKTMLDVITYVLVAFTAISLIVSSVMIGIITYVSVVERVKEIGVLRSLGARKRDIKNLFNAETFIIGLGAGLIGAAVTYLLEIPINAIIFSLSGISGIASLPILTAGIMVLISVALTLISGLIPASAAAKKDPVIALRTE